MNEAELNAAPFASPQEDRMGQFSAPEASIEAGIVDEPNRIRKFGHAVKRSTEGAILFAEVTPINEAMRIAAGGAAIAAGADPLVTAGVYGGATFAIEGPAAIAAASWLDTKRSQKAMQWFNDKLEKRGISPEAEFSPVTKAGIAFLGGSAIVTAVKHREDLERTKVENRRYGMRAAAALAGACGVQGYLIAKGIEAPDPVNVGGALVGIGSVFAVFKWGRRRVRREEAEQGINPDTLERNNNG